MKYVGVVLAFILMVIAAIFGVRLISKQLKELNTSPVSSSQMAYTEYQKAGVKLRFSIVGPVVADESHRELVYEIGQGTRSVKLYKGYNSSLVKEQSLGNNFNSYDSFAKSLYTAGFTNELQSKKDSKYMGECPSGNLYRAELIGSDGKTQKSLWKASCTSKVGNLNGDYSLILELFKQQFPEYKSFASDITID